MCKPRFSLKGSALTGAPFFGVDRKLYNPGGDGQLNAEQQSANAETEAAQAAGLALSTQRRRRRAGSLQASRGVRGAVSGSGAPSGGSILSGGRSTSSVLSSYGAPTFTGPF